MKSERFFAVRCPRPYPSPLTSNDAFCYSGRMTTVAELPFFRRQSLWLVAQGERKKGKLVVSLRH
jgi:hypothetical protein